jgi:hypothetical protein
MDAIGMDAVETEEVQKTDNQIAYMTNVIDNSLLKRYILSVWWLVGYYLSNFIYMLVTRKTQIVSI